MTAAPRNRLHIARLAAALALRVHSESGSRNTGAAASDAIQPRRLSQQRAQQAWEAAAQPLSNETSEDISDAR